MDYTDDMIQQHVTRFLTRYRWHCAKCDSPWFGATTLERATERLKAHRCEAA